MEIDLSVYFSGLSGHLSGAADGIEQELAVELETFMARARQSAIAMSEGPYSLEALAKMGHPYAKRNPHPPMDAAIINRQSGRFIQSWRVTPVERALSGLGIKLVNDAPYADYLDEGTSLMIRRPIIQRLEERLLPELVVRLQEAVDRFWGRHVPEFKASLKVTAG